MKVARKEQNLANTDTDVIWNTPRRGALEQQLEILKERLLSPILRSMENTALMGELRRVANEAAAVAWWTVCPALVFPALFEEMVRGAFERWERQERLRQHGRLSLRLF